MNRNEKGQISPAQSKIARSMRPKLKVIARGQKDEYRKAYTKHGARLHKKGLLRMPHEYEQRMRESLRKAGK